MSASFRSILNQVTQEKLEDLKVQKDLLSAHFQPALKKAKDSKSPKEALQALYEAARDSPVQDSIDSVLIENLKNVLENSKNDSSLSTQLLSAWIARCEQEINYSLRKCEYSYLYGSLLSEWLELEERKNSVDSKAGLEQNRVLREEAILKFKKIMFTAPSAEEFVASDFQKFLEQDLFNFAENPEGEAILKEIRKETSEFFNIENFYISTHDVQCCIKGLCSEELLSNEKKAALKELSDNSEALDEVASLLTNRLKNLKRWDWPAATEVDVRRGMAGEFKPFLNEDIITALFLQYVGVEWGAYFKRQFLKLYNSKVWVKLRSAPLSIEGQRKEFHQRQFLSSLPDSMQSQEKSVAEEYAKIECEALCDMAPRMMQMVQCSAPAPPPGAMSFGASSGISNSALFGQTQSYELTEKRAVMKKKRVVCPPKPIPKPDIDLKQSFLHVLSTEIRLHQVVKPEKPLVVVQADLETFGPSVIHDSVLSALQNLGVPSYWLAFFKKFLQPKVKFAENEDPAAVLRGLPTAHALSNFFGETLLFLLDFLLNRKCTGMKLYRIQDEFWFWGAGPEGVVKAWETMNTFGRMVGLKINASRSGSVSVFSEEQAKGSKNDLKVAGPEPLPQSSIHWGYLELVSSGIFKIDQKAITKFLDEMKQLLGKAECVLEWINVFNKHVAFFIRNFGKCAIVSGKQHLDQIIASLKIIYSGLFGSESGSPVEALKGTYEKLRNADIVDAWAYWPLERGGLGLVNPFIGVMALRQAYVDLNDDDHFRKLPAQDRLTWEELKEEHERRYGHLESQSHPTYIGQGQVQVGPPKFPTWDEYLAKRETDLTDWHNRYLCMLERPGPKQPKFSDQFWTLDAPIPEEEQERTYLMWLFTYYETQLLLHFGSVKFINSKLLPMSMIASIQKSKVNH